MLAVHCQPALPYHIDYQPIHIRIHNPSSTRLLRLNRLNASAFDVPSGIPRALGTSQPLEPAYIIQPQPPDCKHSARFQQQSSLCVPRAYTHSSARGTISCLADRPLHWFLRLTVKIYGKSELQEAVFRDVPVQTR